MNVTYPTSPWYQGCVIGASLAVECSYIVLHSTMSENGNQTEHGPAGTSSRYGQNSIMCRGMCGFECSISGIEAPLAPVLRGSYCLQMVFLLCRAKSI